MGQSDVETLTGVVLEVQPAGHYTYVCVGDAADEGRWAVVMGELDALPGENLTLLVQGQKDNFHSSRLERDFERLFFATLQSRI